MMGPIAAAESVLFKSFRVNGRATRAEYWWWALVQTVVLTGALWLDITRHFGSDMPPPLNPLEYASLVVALLTIPANFCVTIRRLHDSGRSGFWYLIMFAPIVGPVWFLVLMLLPSERDDNLYGPTPYPRNIRGVPGEAGLTAQGQKARKDPLQAYAILDRLHDEPAPTAAAARKAEIREYYRNRVLNTQAGPSAATPRT